MRPDTHRWTLTHAEIAAVYGLARTPVERRALRKVLALVGRLQEAIFSPLGDHLLKAFMCVALVAERKVQPRRVHDKWKTYKAPSGVGCHGWLALLAITNAISSAIES